MSIAGPDREFPAKPLAYVLGGGLFLFALWLLAPWFTVEPNERAVVTRWGAIQRLADPGLNWKLPLAESVKRFRVDISEVSPPRGVNTYTIDNQEVDVMFNVFYRIPPAQVECVYQNVPDYRDRLFIMAVDRLKVEMGKVNVTSVAEKRGELRDAVKSVLQRDAGNLCLEVTDFQLSDLQYTQAFRDAVNQAAIQKANIETREYERQQAQKSAERAKIDAEGAANAVRAKAAGDADARLLNATAEAKAIELKGNAEAAAIKAQADALRANPNLVDLRRAERWDGKLPSTMYGSAPIPFLNVESGK